MVLHQCVQRPKAELLKYQLDVTPAITFEMNKAAEMAMKALAYFT